MKLIKSLFSKHKAGITACVLIATFGIGYWAFGNPGASTIGEDISVGGDLTVTGTSSFTGNITIGGGSGKITTGTIDPVFDIDGTKYATYVPDFVGGTRVETSGVLGTNEGGVEIDFNNLETGSNLWLFWQSSNKSIEDVVVLLTPSFDGEAWYEKEGEKVVIWSDKEGEVSYRLSAPRVDNQKWGNLAEDQELEGIKIYK